MGGSLSADVLSHTGSGKKNPLDKNISMPEGYKTTKKDIPTLLRKCFAYPDNESVQEEVDRFCKLKEIEEELFESVDKCDEESMIMPGYIPIRLYISTMTPRDFISKIATRIATVTQEVGAAHLAIQVADKVGMEHNIRIKWHFAHPNSFPIGNCSYFRENSTLVRFEKWEGKNCLAILYPQKGGEEVSMIKDTPEMRLALCRVIQKWNCTKEYHSITANCQTFAAEVFQALGFESKFSKFAGQVGNFLKYIGTYHSEKIYPCLVVNGEKIEEWQTHEELEEWDEQYGSNYPDHTALLKGFHRGFQVQGQMIQCKHKEPTLLLVSEVGKQQSGNGQEELNSTVTSQMPLTTNKN